MDKFFEKYSDVICDYVIITMGTIMIVSLCL